MKMLLSKELIQLEPLYVHILIHLSLSSISLKYGVLPMFKELKNESLVEPSNKNNTTRFEGISSSNNSGECGVIPYEIENL